MRFYSIVKIVSVVIVLFGTADIVLSKENSQKTTMNFTVLDPNQFEHYIDFFNKWDAEPIKNHIDNSHCWEWMVENIPFFECPDSTVEEIYYFRWWVYRKHIKETPQGFVVTEFLPEVGHAQKYNTIACAAPLHIEEGRWLKNQKYLTDYINFWFSEEANPRQYSNWLVNAIWNYCLVSGDYEMPEDLLLQFVESYEGWEKTNLHKSGLFWSEDDRDGGEYSISSHGLRPTLNSYLYADAQTISLIAKISGNEKIAKRFQTKADNLKKMIHDRLWDSKDRFFKNVHLENSATEVEAWDFQKMDPDHNVREIYGFIPWKFDIADEQHSKAWTQIIDTNGFATPFGFTTAEQRHPRFMKYRKKRCQWDGSVWPFTSSITLKGMANFLGSGKQNILTKENYFDALKTFAFSQHRTLPFGEVIPWIGESLHPYTGRWLSRDMNLEVLSGVKYPGTSRTPIRGKDYNHSTFCDLVINDLIGLKPGYDNTIEINPLVPDDWEWFCLDDVLYHGKKLSIYYDKSGKKYNKGKGFFVLLNGKQVFNASEPRYLRIKF